MNKNKKIEIMSPVGSYESLMAAFQGGADSIYFGVGKLNMRSRSSKNFSLDDLVEIVKRCEEHLVKSYLTLNTVIYDNEVAEMKKVVDKAKEANVSAVIASDLAVIQYAKDKNLAVHISTQCNISNFEAVKYYAQYSDVMVLARELNLEQVQYISDEIENQNLCGPSGKKIKLEMFAHGALCMAISGKCYLSLDNMNFSANKGECLQVCRRPYQVKDKDGGIELEVDNEYIMSPKDLMTIDFLDKIIASGVQILKIEGRGRSADYVKTTTSAYKNAVESIENKTYSKDKIEDWKKKLATVFNRGFWDGYYLGKKIGEWSEVYGSQSTQKKTYVGKVTNYFTKLQVAEVLLEAGEIQVGDKVVIMGPTTGVIETEINEIRLDLKAIEKAEKGSICSIPVNAFLRRSDKIYLITKRL
jgi:U32 family peptidase